MFSNKYIVTFINLLKAKEGIIIAVFINIFLFIFGGLLADVSTFFAAALSLLQIFAFFCFLFSLFYFIKRKMR